MSRMKISAQLSFRNTDMEDAQMILDNAKADGYTHARIVVTRYVPKVVKYPCGVCGRKNRVLTERATCEKCSAQRGVPGRIHLRGKEGRVRAL